MTPAARLLASEIAAHGPVSFRRFMEVALYHKVHGYYRSQRDPFGKHGDFYTAEQMQPVFGTLIAACIRELWRKEGEPADFTVVELGAGRCEMREALSEWRYVPVDIEGGALPERFRGVVFSNEFFDALPVDVAVYRGGRFLERRVNFSGGAFVWEEEGAVPERVDAYLRTYFPPPEEGRVYEINLAALDWIGRIAASLERGWVFTVDYGYTSAESLRFPEGTLMGYRRHTASDAVLLEPGSRDITAHVNFSALEAAGNARGWRTERFQSLMRTLLDAGEADQFAAALDAPNEAETVRRRLQLKTLLFGMGETFRVILQAAGR